MESRVVDYDDIIVHCANKCMGNRLETRKAVSIVALYSYVSILGHEVKMKRISLYLLAFHVNDVREGS